MRNYLHNSKKSSTFAPAFEIMAGWMSDLVNGLQNRLERFDSATGLTEKSLFGVTFLVYYKLKYPVYYKSKIRIENWIPLFKT